MNEPRPLPAFACPLCGGDNACAPARAGRFQGVSCWCEGQRFAPERLADVPAASRDRACLCSRCAGVTRPRD